MFYAGWWYACCANGGKLASDTETCISALQIFVQALYSR